MENSRQTRVLEIFFRGLRGEDLSVQKLADEYVQLWKILCAVLYQ